MQNICYFDVCQGYISCILYSNVKLRCFSFLECLGLSSIFGSSGSSCFLKVAQGLHYCIGWFLVFSWNRLLWWLWLFRILSRTFGFGCYRIDGSAIIHISLCYHIFCLDHYRFICWCQFCNHCCCCIFKSIPYSF